MYVCVCMAVTETEVDDAIAAGAHTREAVTRACRAGGDCGSCHHMIEEKIEDHLDESGPIACPGVRPAAGEQPLVAPERLVAGRRSAA